MFYNSVYSWSFFTLLTAGNVLTSYRGFHVMYRLNRFCMIKPCYCCKNTFACNFSCRTSPGLAKFVSSGRVVCAAVRLVLCKSSLPEFMGSQGELFGPAGHTFRSSRASSALLALCSPTQSSEDIRKLCLRSRRAGARLELESSAMS